MKIVSWNVNSLNARLPFVLDWVAKHEPDVLCLQETKLKDDDFPYQAFKDIGYNSVHFGQGRWNGVAIVSKAKGEDVVCGGVAEYFEGQLEARHLAATVEGIRVHSVYVPNGRSLEDAHFDYKLRWLGDLRSLLEKECKLFDQILVAGDFNIAPDDQDVWDPAAYVGCTHVSDDERSALKSIEDLGFVDVARHLNPNDVQFSWWDYRGGAFHKGEGLRIDLALVSNSLISRVVSARIDRDARKVSKAGKPSDHAPLELCLR
ncbi:exodeoxyribonuclease-3 [Ferrithrix thermotolerans DSM 19514]|uniref:Exodeoxyribonuclease-3 n=1 Tax=Ferrithrix thermotolerans DSM 19514 TaxID=1121881 RepID=A0A1M4T3I8_9ACTN|nr:exodeoxyribonuclease III [Ferrithrix thermotolerans]SHE38974.1 exodeoxyribonuclease-3 [Ferrithrix thermotolerans DSM 19514]